MVRISMSNERGGEYFVMIPADDGKSYRAQRETALIMIEQAIQAGLEPGEVRAA